MYGATFGKAFHTRKEANAYLKKWKLSGHAPSDITVRHMSKKIHPRRKKRFHVGGYMDFLNFA